MRRFLKITFGLILAGLVIIQFIPVDFPENQTSNPGDIIENGMTNTEIAIILKTSCYDCHSNQVKYPWYANVAPVSWLLKKDIELGKKELNFSEWTDQNKRRLLRKLKDIKEVTEENKMPLSIYTFVHRNAKLSDTQKQQLINWVEESTATLMNQ